jgi:UDP-glucuronate decarboxylase
MRTLRSYGEGNQTRSFCYVSDLVNGLMRLMETADDVSGPVNLGNPVEFPIRQLAEMVIALTGSSSKIVHRPLPEDDPSFGNPNTVTGLIETDGISRSPRVRHDGLCWCGSGGFA